MVHFGIGAGPSFRLRILLTPEMSRGLCCARTQYGGRRFLHSQALGPVSRMRREDLVPLHVQYLKL